MAIGVTVICSAFVSVLAALLLGQPFLSMLGSPVDEVLVAWLAGLVIAMVAFFWCATASRGPLQAVLWIIPFGAAVLLSYAAGPLAAFLVGSLLSSALPSSLYPFFLTDSVRSWVFSFRASDVVRLLLIVPAFIVALEQTFRLFRQEIRASQSARRLLVLATVVLAGSAINTIPQVLYVNAYTPVIRVLSETADSVRAYGVNLEQLKETGRLELSVHTLGKARPLSAGASQWLGDTRVVITSKKPGAASSVPNDRARYFISVRLLDRMECFMDEHPAHSMFSSCVPLRPDQR
jgi:hypothetical protein